MPMRTHHTHHFGTRDVPLPRHGHGLAIERMRAVCTAMEITTNAASSTVSEVPTDLPMGRNEQLSTEHTHTAVVQVALLVWLPPEKWTGILSAGTGHRSDGALQLSEPFPISLSAGD